MKTIPKIEDIIGDYPEFAGVHPIANAFPMKPDDEFWEFVEHIREHGVAQELMREKGTNLLIDGRNRLLAVSITQSLFEIVDVQPEHVLAYVTAANLHAKKFDASQRSMIGKNLMPFYAERAKERQREQAKINQPQNQKKEKIPSSEKGQARDEAGAAAGVNGKYVDMAVQVAKVDEKLAEDVLNGKVKLKDAHAKVKPIIAAAKAEEKANKPAKEKEKVKIVTADGRVTEIDKPAKPVFNETNDSVSWARWTWNPVTGCNHGCKFCYAREIAHSDRMAAVYPFQFAPAYHEYRLDAPKNTALPKSGNPVDGRVFVCSMADLFGKWVPDAWIKAVFQSAIASPEWEYLFLTKWPKRYAMLADLPKAWFGASIIKQGDVERVTSDMTSFEAHAGIVRWVSLEPMLEPITFDDLSWCDLMVIGAQTSTTQPDAGYVPAFAPKFEWVADVVTQCRAAGVPYYLKPNLLTAPGMEMTQMQPRRKK
jgi:protein gp37